MRDIFMYIAISIVATCWVITPFLKRIIGQSLSSIDLYVNTQIIIIMYELITLFIMKCCKYNFDLFTIKKLDKNQLITLFTAALTTYIGSITLLWLIKH